jgi:hypothetical protein
MLSHSIPLPLNVTVTSTLSLRTERGKGGKTGTPLIAFITLASKLLSLEDFSRIIFCDLPLLYNLNETTATRLYRWPEGRSQYFIILSRKRTRYSSGRSGARSPVVGKSGNAVAPDEGL